MLTSKKWTCMCYCYLFFQVGSFKFFRPHCSPCYLGDLASEHICMIWHPQKNKGMMPVGSQSTEEVDQNYVPMSANSPSHHHSGSLSEPVHEANYVPMTPSTMEFSSLGKQVPPPAHMGFRSSPKTPPRRPIHSDCQPPPVDRNLKPDRKGEMRNGVHACVAAAWFIFCEYVLPWSGCVLFSLLLRWTSFTLLGIH